MWGGMDEDDGGINGGCERESGTGAVVVMVMV